jgi:hypothetical protein
MRATWHFLEQSNNAGKQVEISVLSPAIFMNEDGEVSQEGAE